MGAHGWGVGRNDRGRYRAEIIERVHGVILKAGRWRPPIASIEWLMGLPYGWLHPAATPSSPRSPSTSAG